jgi:hypothetical protein
VTTKKTDEYLDLSDARFQSDKILAGSAIKAMLAHGYTDQASIVTLAVRKYDEIHQQLDHARKELINKLDTIMPSMPPKALQKQGFVMQHVLIRLAEQQAEKHAAAEEASAPTPFDGPTPEITIEALEIPPNATKNDLIDAILKRMAKNRVTPR